MMSASLFVIAHIMPSLTLHVLVDQTSCLLRQVQETRRTHVRIVYVKNYSAVENKNEQAISWFPGKIMK